MTSLALAREAIAHCHRLAQCTEEPGRITRTFQSAPMRDVHALVAQWMREANLEPRTDSAGNIRGARGGKRVLVGSHLDTVPNAGAFDGILGVMLGLALAKALPDQPLEVIGFSEEEGVRFGIPFIGSRAVIGDPVQDQRVLEALAGCTGDPLLTGDETAFFEIHIEQGPVLEARNEPIGIVTAIAGQSRYELRWTGAANHAGTTPMSLRRDALAAAAEWIVFVEKAARKARGLVATVGRVQNEPNAGNVVPGLVVTSLDVRHENDSVRRQAVDSILSRAKKIAKGRGLKVAAIRLLDQRAVAMDASFIKALGPGPRLVSGAGHDAMILARRLPTAMLFIRSPRGLSHHPNEAVRARDVAVALERAKQFLCRMNS